ncbi:hypothetical protein EDB85DRAFT_1983732 [Lactarius pseudohatsudake]|nr:hypothetical protein EDB85DRAFT_1983732 [Lactarius pseudohatsudake]
MSEEQPRWLERNVDVLQLLESDEPEEIAVIKMVLIQHLELDSKVTLGVHCDQITRPSACVRRRSSSRSSHRTPGSPSSPSCKAKGAVLPSKKMR